MKTPKHNDLRAWKARLVHRKYTDLADPRTRGHFSARIDHDSCSGYFPLGSDDETRAAVRALEIHLWVETKGWHRACQRYTREFTLAVFWSGNPLLCTYTTLFTEPGSRAAGRAARPARGAIGTRLLIVEADDQVRHALVQWTRHLPGCSCVGAFPSPGAALPRLSRKHADLVLFNRSLSDVPPSLAAASPAATPAWLAFGIYETSDDIFISHTGVSRGYFLQRTTPALLLAPAGGAWSEGTHAQDPFSPRTRDYFQELISGSSGVRPAGEKSALTPREEEILLRLSKGCQDKQIADELNISTWTVHNHIKNIFKKLDVHTRTQAVIKHLQK